MQRFIVSALVAMAAISAGMQFFTSMTQQTERFLQKDLVLETSWAEFKYTNNKAYPSAAEEAFRKSEFAKAHAFILKHNANPNRSYSVGMNPTADLSRDEFRAQKLRPKNMKSAAALKGAKKFTAPKNYRASATGVDWREEGAVNAIKDQGQCGSCWAFGAVAALEGAYWKQHNHVLPNYSEQQLVDCVTTDMGCNGGLQEDAFTYLKTAKMMTEESYPYTAQSGTCSYDPENNTGVNVVGYNKVEPDSVTDLLAALDQQVVTVSIEADGFGFQLYTSGIFNDETCGTSLDHAVALVGYGEGYFILRNSWGANSWGESGYMKIAQESTNAHGICGVLSDPLTVTVS